MARPAHTLQAARRASELRRQMTVSEARLWRFIRNRATGARFRRQVPIGYWIADFACLDPRLVVEVDDTSHEFRDETIRTGYFESKSFAVLRFSNQRVAQELPEVVGTITAGINCMRENGRPPE